MPIKRPTQAPPEPPLVGRLHDPPPDAVAPWLRYEHPHGQLWVGDSATWLASLPAGSVDLVFADPPYNLARAAWDDFADLETYLAWSMRWIEAAERVLTPAGSLYLCGYSEILAELKPPAARLFAGCRWLVWHYRNKANLGRDWGRSHESILHLRKSSAFRLDVDAVRVPYGGHTLKYPSHPQAASSQYGGGVARAGWVPNPRGAKPRDVIELPTTCNGMGEKTPHPTQKPESLVRRLVLAASRAGDLVVDPFSGSGTTAVVAEQLGRRWAGCDLDPTYHQWAAQRVSRVVPTGVEAWIEADRRTAARREGIR